jgi:hypothetical protein
MRVFVYHHAHGFPHSDAFAFRLVCRWFKPRFSACRRAALPVLYPLPVFYRFTFHTTVRALDDGWFAVYALPFSAGLRYVCSVPLLPVARVAALIYYTFTTRCVCFTGLRLPLFVARARAGWCCRHQLPPFVVAWFVVVMVIPLVGGFVVADLG